MIAWIAPMFSGCVGAVPTTCQSLRASPAQETLAHAGDLAVFAVVLTNCGRADATPGFAGPAAAPNFIVGEIQWEGRSWVATSGGAAVNYTYSEDFRPAFGMPNDAPLRPGGNLTMKISWNGTFTAATCDHSGCHPDENQVAPKGAYSLTFRSRSSVTSSSVIIDFGP